MILQEAGSHFIATLIDISALVQYDTDLFNPIQRLGEWRQQPTAGSGSTLASPRA